MHREVPGGGSAGGRTLKRTGSYTFKRAYFCAYITRHRQDPSKLGTVMEGSCPFVQQEHTCVLCAPHATLC